jgi:long-chain acyl-CoA synthetase
MLRYAKGAKLNLVKKTIGQLFLKRSKISPSSNAIGWIENDNLKFLNYKEYRNVVESISLAIIKKGIIKHDKVCILSNTRREWHFLDLGVLCSGAAVIPIYHTYLAHEIQYIINHSEAKMIIIEDNDQLNKLIKVIPKLDSLKFIVTIDKISEDLRSQIPESIHYYTYQKLLSTGSEELIANPDTFELKINNLHDDDLASIIYTSGTTGEPKGAVVTHGAFTHMLLNVKSFTHNSINESDRTLTFLPLSHVFGRCDSLLNLVYGNETVYAESMEKLIENIQLAKPTIMLAVPRVFEKIYEKVTLEIRNSSSIKQGVFDWAMKAANSYYETISKNKSPSTLEIIQFNAAYKLVFSKVYEKFGGRIRYFISGGAPLSVGIIEFLRNSNLTLLEGYGLTETIAPCSLNPLSKQIPGTVGRPIGDVEFKFADDFEILIKSKAMFKEYYKNPQATEQAIDADGWFHSGDIGHFTTEGFLKITDRKKDIIITSGGKNIAPQKIENLLKMQPNISQCAISGDKQKYLTAIIGIEKESFKNVIDTINDETTVDDLSKNIQVISMIEEQIQFVNKDLAKFETIKKFYIAPIEFSTDNYLTPSLKIKKKLVLETYKEKIDSMYKD